MTKTAIVDVDKNDSRCAAYFAVVDTAKMAISPANVTRTSDMGEPLRPGSWELKEGNALVRYEANHHRKMRGWSAWVVVCTGEDTVEDRYITTGSDSKNVKNWLRANGHKSLSVGAGELGAVARFLHLVRIVGAKRALKILDGGEK